MSAHFTRAAAGAVTALAVVVAAAAPSLAATRPHRKSPSFRVQGVVVAVHGRAVTVLSSTTRVGGQVGRHRLVTLNSTRSTRLVVRPGIRRGAGAAAPRLVSMTSAGAGGGPTGALVPGAEVVATGTVTDGQLVATTETVTPLPAEALVGTVTAASQDGKTFTVAGSGEADGDHSGDEGGAPTVVDAEHAAFNGPAHSAGGLTAGQQVVVLGERNDGDMLAARVFTFAGAATVVVGTVSAADPAGHTLTLADHGAQGEQDESDSGASSPTGTVTVDISTADIVLNGNEHGTSPAQSPAVGDEVLAVGTGGGAGQLTAQLVFGFDQHDNGPVGQNQD